MIVTRHAWRTAPAAALPTYLIIRYPIILGATAITDSAPTLVETYDYTTFYAVGRSNPAPLLLLGYEILHRFQVGSSGAGVVRAFAAWMQRQQRRSYSERYVRN